MKLTPVEEIPKRGYHRLQDLITEFMDGPNDIVRVDFTSLDYKSATSCSSCLHSAVKRSGYKIMVAKRKDNVYLCKI